jgi:hypothetical protein
MKLFPFVLLLIPLFLMHTAGDQANPQTAQPQQVQQAQKAKPDKKSECYWIEDCARYGNVCVAGCDPPDAKGTVRGCSPCKTKERKCVATKLVWFCPNM